ncbi:MAG: hypothetical protein JXB35_17870 [Anaerolineae bacterium]|nr:hypothetical protein [Anaerolineae bacterium]
MAKCTIEIEIKGNVKDLLAQTRKAIENAGGKFEGNEKKGEFSVGTPVGPIEGEYKVRAGTASTKGAVELSITDKPFFVSCDMIEQELRKYME